MLINQSHPTLSTGKKLVFTLVTVGLVLLVCELGIRVWGIMDPGRHAYVPKTTTGMPQVDDVVDVKVRLPESPTAEFNAEGMRDREYVTTKPPGAFRILGLGDSITFGWSVPSDQTYVKRLETLLNTRNRGPRTFEVMNTGVPSWNTLYEQAYLTTKGLAYQPDLVIVGFCLNDADPSIPPADLFTPGAQASRPGVFPVSAVEWVARQRKPEPPPAAESSQQTVKVAAPADTMFAKGQQLVERAQEQRFRGGIGLPYGVKTFFADHSHLYRFIRWKYDVFLKRAGIRLEYPYTLYLRDAEGWRLCQRALDDIRRTMADRQVKVVLVIFPFFMKLNDAYPWEALHQVVAAAGRESRMVVVDLLPFFKGRDPREVGADPYHPNAEGHRIAADAVYRALMANHLIPITTEDEKAH